MVGATHRRKGWGGGVPPSFLYVTFLGFFLAMQVPFWNTSPKKGMNNLEKKNSIAGYHMFVGI